MNFDFLQQVLTDAKLIHRSMSKRIDFSKQDNVHGVYLIQGGILTAATSALKFNHDGYIVPVAQQKRLIDEALDLIWFFDELPDEARQVKAWFRGEVVERQLGHSGNLSLEDRSKQSGLSVDELKMLQATMAKLNNQMSKYMHPTISAMRANASKSNNIFDYDHKYTAVVSVKANDFSELYIIPSLNALLISRKTLAYLTKEQVAVLNGYRKRINDFLDEQI